MNATDSIAEIVDQLIGTPYRCGGRDPVSGLDCWGVVVAVRRRLGLPVEDVLGYPEDWSAKGQGHLDREVVRGPWDRIAEPGPGDVALYATRRDGIADHAGIVIDRTWGAQQRRGTALHRYRLEAMRPFLVGYFRRRT